MNKKIITAFLLFIISLAAAHLFIAHLTTVECRNILIALIKQKKNQGLMLDDTRFSSLANMMIESNEKVYVKKAHFDFLLTNKTQEFVFGDIGNFFNNFNLTLIKDNFNIQMDLVNLYWTLWRQVLVAIFITAIILMLIELLNWKHQKAKFQIVEQLAHDIQSPLTALSAVANKYSPITILEREKLILLSIGRINAIIEKLRRFNQGEKYLATEIFDIVLVIKSIIAEKNASIPIHFKSNDKKCMVDADRTEFARIISNLINNALEALSTEIYIKIEDGEIVIGDNGSGIPKSILNNLGKRGNSNKINGSGLGLWHAKKTIEKFKWKFSFNTSERGTEIFIKFKECNAELPLFVLIENDLLVRIIWEQKAREMGVHFVAFADVDSFLSGKYSLNKNANIYIDQELDNNVYGEDVAKKLNRSGFLNLNLSTGHDAENFTGRKDLSFLKSVIGKQFPLCTSSI